MYRSPIPSSTYEVVPEAHTVMNNICRFIIAVSIASIVCNLCTTMTFFHIT
jgi:hypothetical protein